jgi:hypothetical protein
VETSGRRIAQVREAAERDVQMREVDMTDSMIERMSSALMELDGHSHDWRHYSDDAFAILREMREPTLAMLEAAQDKVGAGAWRAMVDAVLAEAA